VNLVGHAPGPAGIDDVDPIDDLVRRLPALGACRADVQAAIDVIASAFGGGGKLLVCGNGGSAADSEHLVADLMKAFMLVRPIPADEQRRLLEIGGQEASELAGQLQGAMPALALGSNGAFTTAMGNDVSYDLVFAQQVYGLGRPGDVLMAISTTGTSPSVVQAALVARLRGMKVLLLTGRDGGDAAPIADVAIRVPADRVYEIQELHLPVYHAIALALEQRFFGPDPVPGR
jgi:D-sedoheptulose 7-phosphate isomerase